VLKETNAAKISISTLCIGIAGFFVSLYTLILHLQSLAHPGFASLCDINAKFNCSDVINSAYGELGSIPLGSYGMTYFIIILVAALLPKISAVTTRQLLIIESLIGFTGFLGVLSLLYISNVILRKICPTCTVIHVLIVFYFVLNLIGLYRNKEIIQPTEKGTQYLIRFFVVSAVLGSIPLIAGLFAPLVIASNFANADKEVVKPVLAMTSQEQLMQFNPAGNGEDYRRGSDQAKVVLQMFSDFGCPHCKKAIAELVQAQDEVGLDKVLIVYRFFPLNSDCNSYLSADRQWYPYGCVLTQAARCAGRQGKFWEFKDWGFSGQEWTEEERKQNFSTAGLKQEAQTLGMDSDRFMQCVESGETLTKIKTDEGMAHKLNIQGTPYIIINGTVYDGDFNKAGFIKAFKAQLEKISVPEQSAK
jgi:protein-disulfide isomerase/uncharacterized membrane protein